MSVIMIRILLFILISLYSMLVFGQTSADGNPEKHPDFKVYPTISSYDHRLDFYAETPQSIVVNWIDLSGRTIMYEKLTLEKGANSFSIRNSAKLTRGTYVVTSVVDGKRLSGRIIVL